MREIAMLLDYGCFDGQYLLFSLITKQYQTFCAWLLVPGCFRLIDHCAL